MSPKKRPKSAKDVLGRQAAELRRGAPGGKRFVGDARAQSERAKHEELERVHRMAEVDAARREAEVPEPLTAIVAELVQDAVSLVRTIATAPFRIAAAFFLGHSPREA